MYRVCRESNIAEYRKVRNKITNKIRLEKKRYIQTKKETDKSQNVFKIFEELFAKQKPKSVESLKIGNIR